MFVGVGALVGVGAPVGVGAWVGEGVAVVSGVVRGEASGDCVGTLVTASVGLSPGLLVVASVVVGGKEGVGVSSGGSLGHPLRLRLSSTRVSRGVSAWTGGVPARGVKNGDFNIGLSELMQTDALCGARDISRSLTGMQEPHTGIRQEGYRIST